MPSTTENIDGALQPGRVAVITGAASGIGLAAAKKLAGRGLKLVIVRLRETPPLYLTEKNFLPELLRRV